MIKLDALNETQLEEEKLRAEIADLKKSIVLQPSFWFSCLGAAVALTTAYYAAVQDGKLKELSRVELENAEDGVRDVRDAAKEEKRVAESKYQVQLKRKENYDNARGEFEFRYDDPFVQERLPTAENAVADASSALATIRNDLASLRKSRKELGSILRSLPNDALSSVRSALRGLDVLLKQAEAGK